jgi:hypothetical protein
MLRMDGTHELKRVTWMALDNYGVGVTSRRLTRYPTQAPLCSWQNPYQPALRVGDSAWGS